MVGSIEVDASRFPLVVVTFDGVQTAADVDEYLETFDRIHDRKQPFALVVRLKRYSSGHELRVRMGAWMKKCEPLTRAYCVCTAIVTTSLGFRFVLSSIFLIKPLVVPYRVCATEAEALAFVRSELGKRGLQLGSGLAL